MSDSDTAADNVTAHSRALTISYCPICTLPHEFCSYGPSFDKCKAWLQHNKPDLLQQLYPNTQSTDNVDTVTKSLDNATIDDKSKKSSKKSKSSDTDGSDDNDSDNETETKPKKTLKTPKVKAPGNILITKSTRSKNKYITTVRGLDGYSIVLKDAAKLMSKKFACSASVVTVKETNTSEIAIQGDCVDDMADFIVEKYSNVPQDNVYIVSEKTGKKVKAFD